MVTKKTPDIASTFDKNILSPLEETIQNTDYTSDYASLLVPDDEKILEAVFACASQLGSQTKNVIVVGIGGSNLGTKAIYDALLPDLSGAKLFFADTVDPWTLQNILNTVFESSTKADEIALVCISKSGTTTETVANFSILFAELSKHYGTFPHSRVVMITDPGSKLETVATQNQYLGLSIPTKVGGRYSVFSAVGLLPLLLAGVDIKQLRKGAFDARTQNIQHDSLAATLASFAFSAMQQGKTVYDQFFFAPRLETVGKWYRQLFAESLGKNGKGMIPTVSIGSADLHSIVQSYLGGPQPFITAFISTTEASEYIVDERTTPLVSGIAGKKVETIMDAILEAVKVSYQKYSIPFVHVHMDAVDAYHLGYFLQLQMITVMILGILLQVNAFDQPNVEDYKAEMRKILVSTV